MTSLSNEFRSSVDRSKAPARFFRSSWARFLSGTGFSYFTLMIFQVIFIEFSLRMGPWFCDRLRLNF